MTKTVRIRDDDANRIEIVRNETGLSTAEAAHYLFHRHHDWNDDVRQTVRRDVRRKAALHPEWNENNPEKNELLVDQTVFDSAETLLSDVAMPRFSPHYDPELDP